LTMSSVESVDVLRIQEDVPARWRGSTSTRTSGRLGSTPGVRVEQQVSGEHVLTSVDALRMHGDVPARWGRCMRIRTSGWMGTGCWGCAGRSDLQCAGFHGIGGFVSSSLSSLSGGGRDRSEDALGGAVHVSTCAIGLRGLERVGCLCMRTDAGTCPRSIRARCRRWTYIW
jgi:hypothetical protein